MLTTQTSRLINTSPDILYNAFTDPAALETWMGPGKMKDRYTIRPITLQPYKKIVLGIRFDTGGPGYVGEMVMEVRFDRQSTATLVTIIFTNIPLGVKPEDNEKATESSLDNLERYLGLNDN